jgi:hypothetical protein
MSCYLTPMAGNEACAKAFARDRRYVMEQAARESCGKLVRECISVNDPRTVILMFESGKRFEVQMPRPRDLEIRRNEQ